MQKTSSIAIAAALAFFAMPAFAQEQNSSTTGQESRRGRFHHRTARCPAARRRALIPPRPGTTVPTGGRHGRLDHGTAQTDPAMGTDMNSGTAQDGPGHRYGHELRHAQTAPATGTDMNSRHGADGPGDDAVDRYRAPARHTRLPSRS